MKRLFTFGCSYTSWAWPTWADILIQEYRHRGLEGYNFGRCGAGNQYIFIKILEADQKYKFTENDTVVVEWTTMQREDRFADNKWHTPGNIYTQSIYKEDFIYKWADPIHYVFRDCAAIKSVQKLYKLSGVNYVDFSMSTFKYLDSGNYSIQFEDVNKLLDFYKDSIHTTFPAMMEYLGLHERTEVAENKRPLTYWGHDEKTVGREWHPTVEEHYEYLTKIMLPSLGETLSQDTVKFVEKWQDKVNKIPQPINLEQTGWALNYNNSNPL